MQRDLHIDTWTAVCNLNEIVPNTGVCALFNGEQVAVFHIDDGAQQVYAIGNYDANSGASVISRGLVGSLGKRIVVASPIYKHHFDLRTGECIEAPEHSVGTFRARIAEGKVWVGA